MMTALSVTVAIFIGALSLWSCSQAKLVPVCSEHGGIKSMTASDKVDEYYTRDAVCKDGMVQRAEQVDDGNGTYHLVVPSDR